MIRFRRYTILSLFLAALVFSGCKEEERLEPLPPLADKSKTVIAYFFGNSLAYYLNNNRSAMVKAVSENILPANQRMLLFYQRSHDTAEIQEIRYDRKARKADLITLETVELDTLNAEGFTRNITKVMDYAPAESYSIIFLGHSTAWLPKSPTATISLYRRLPAMEKMPDALVTRNIGEYSASLEMDELAKGLAATGKKFDCLYFDVCFMASLEAAYELRNTADFIIGSPCEIMGYGSPYDRILKPLFAEDYRSVCREFYDFYEHYSTPSGCITAIDCSQLESVAATVKHLNSAAVTEDFDISAVQPYEGRNDRHWFFDAVDYYDKLTGGDMYVGELRTRLEKCLPYGFHTESFYSAYNDRMNTLNAYSGISVTPDEKCIEAIERQLESIPENSNRRISLEMQMAELQTYNPSLRRTAWYKATH